MLHPGCENQIQLSLQFGRVLPMLCIIEQICSQNGEISVPSLSLSNEPFLFHPSPFSRASSLLLSIPPSLPPPSGRKVLGMNCRAVLAIRLLNHHPPLLGFLKEEFHMLICRLLHFPRSPQRSSTELTPIPCSCCYCAVKH